MIKDNINKTFFVINCILMICAAIVLIIYLSQIYHNTKYNCNDQIDNQTHNAYSSGCREECGCHIIKEYNIIINQSNKIIVNIPENK